MGRQRRNLSQRKAILIVVEGSREEACFLSAKAEVQVRYDVAVTVRLADRGGGSPDRILDAAVSLSERSGFAKVWCVLDADLFRQESHSRSLQRAKRAGVKVIFSNPCFEVWLFLHFECSHREVESGEYAKARLREIAAKHKVSPACEWRDLRERLRSGLPFQHARRVRVQHQMEEPIDCWQHNSSTAVDILMTALGFEEAEIADADLQ
jgi:hypothetical protein